MKNTTELNNKKYNQSEICPICGNYEPDGGVCVLCQKDYNLYKPKPTYIDGVC